MNGIEALADGLRVWAADNGLTIRTEGGFLRLELPDRCPAVVSFPKQFWETYSAASKQRKDEGLQLACQRVHLLFDPNWRAQIAKDIEIPLAYVQDL